MPTLTILVGYQYIITQYIKNILDSAFNSDEDEIELYLFRYASTMDFS